MNKNLISDIHRFSAIKEQNIKRIFDLAKVIVESYAYEAHKSSDHIIDADIGIGTLAIEAVGDAIRYKFVPSKEFEKDLKKAIKIDTNPVLQKAEKKLEDNITRAYKDLL